MIKKAKQYYEKENIFKQIYYGYNSKYIDTLILLSENKNSDYGFKIKLIFRPQLIKVDYSILTIYIDKIENKLKIKSKYKCYYNNNPIQSSSSYEVESRKFDKRIFEDIRREIDNSDISDINKDIILKSLTKYVSTDKIYF